MVEPVYCRQRLPASHRQRSCKPGSSSFPGARTSTICRSLQLRSCLARPDPFHRRLSKSAPAGDGQECTVFAPDFVGEPGIDNPVALGINQVNLLEDVRAAAHGAAELNVKA